MNFVILDLEWNGSYSKIVHRYFNEIIEIGAVKLDENLEFVDELSVLVKPTVSKKITNLVTNLTGLEEDELKQGCSFQQAFRQLIRFVDEDSVLISWSTTDIFVLLENIQYFIGSKEIGCTNYYADVQSYCQKVLKAGNAKQQLGLSRACEMLNISEEGYSLHRALDDSRLAAKVFAKAYDEKEFAPFIHPTDETFYERLFFKPKVVSKMSSPLLKDEYFRFACPECLQLLEVKGKWRYSNRTFHSEMVCEHCSKKYTARVQVKELFDSVSVRRRLSIEVEPEQEKE